MNEGDVGRKFRSADPAFVFGVSLIASLVLWWPTCQAVMDGNVDVVAGGVRYLISLGVAWTGVWCVSSVINGYARAAAVPPALPPGPPDHPLRRAEDGVMPELDATAPSADEPAA